jgi:hypothetical protein
MIYDFKCRRCGQISADVHLSIRHTQDDHPKCCGETMPMYFTVPPQIHWRHYELENGGFIAHGITGRPVITSLRQRRDLMERHELIDANDFGRPQSKAEQMEHYNTVIKPAIDAITPTPALEAEMKQRGLDDIVATHFGESNGP